MVALAACEEPLPPSDDEEEELTPPAGESDLEAGCGPHQGCKVDDDDCNGVPRAAGGRALKPGEDAYARLEEGEGSVVMKPGEDPYARLEGEGNGASVFFRYPVVGSVLAVYCLLSLVAIMFEEVRGSGLTAVTQSFRASCVPWTMLAIICSSTGASAYAIEHPPVRPHAICFASPGRPSRCGPTRGSTTEGCRSPSATSGRSSRSAVRDW
jgi:hypothetical protein